MSGCWLTSRDCSRPSSAHGRVRSGRVALAARKAQGVKLGNPVNLAEVGAKGAASRRTEADAFAAKVAPVVRAIQAEGATVTSRRRGTC